MTIHFAMMAKTLDFAVYRRSESLPSVTGSVHLLRSATFPRLQAGVEAGA